MKVHMISKYACEPGLVRTPCFRKTRILSTSRNSQHSRCSRLCVKSESQDQPNSEKALAPVEVKTPVGKMLDYYLKMEPHLLTAAIDKQLELLKDEKDKQIEDAKSKGASSDGADMVLYRRINEVRKSEEKATLEELMYICVLEKFVELGVSMMPRVDSMVYHPTGSMKALTEGIHSQEAVEIVKEHVRALMGQAVMAHDAVLIKMPKLQAVQMYVMSIMFGYFIRRVDKRFQLERSAGLLDEGDGQEEAVNRLERLFNQADSMDIAESPDSPSSSESTSTSYPEGFQSDAVSSNISSSGSKQQGQQQSRLKQYISTFGAETVRDMARVLSQEAATLIDMQTIALFGDYRKLQHQMEQAVGSNIISVEDLMEQVKLKLESGAIEATTFSVGAQRRAILEAIAFGTFLRDVESSVDSNYGLLTAARADDFGPGPSPGGLGGNPQGPSGGFGGPQQGGSGGGGGGGSPFVKR